MEIKQLPENLRLEREPRRHLLQVFPWFIIILWKLDIHFWFPGNLKEISKMQIQLYHIFALKHPNGFLVHAHWSPCHCLKLFYVPVPTLLSGLIGSSSSYSSQTRLCLSDFHPYHFYAPQWSLRPPFLSVASPAPPSWNLPVLAWLHFSHSSYLRLALAFSGMPFLNIPLPLTGKTRRPDHVLLDVLTPTVTLNMLYCNPLFNLPSPIYWGLCEIKDLVCVLLLYS